MFEPLAPDETEFGRKLRNDPQLRDACRTFAQKLRGTETDTEMLEVVTWRTFVGMPLPY